MKICIISESFFQLGGGLTSFATRLSSSLRSEGISSVLVTRAAGEEPGAKDDYEDLQVHALPPRGQHSILKYLFLPVLLFWLLVNQHEYDAMLVAGCRVTGVPSVIAAGLLGKPCFLRPGGHGEIYGMPFLQHPLLERVPVLRPAIEKLVHLRNRLFTVGASSYVAISKTIEEEFLEAGFSPDKVVRIPNGVSTSKFAPNTSEVRKGLSEEMNLSADRSHAIYVGTLAPRKRVEILLRAWAKIQCGCKHNLLLVGPARTQAYRKQLIDLTRGLDIQHTVQLVGYVDDVRPFFNVADVFVMASRMEGMSNSLLEAMASGLAPVVTDVSGATEIIESGENGFLVSNEEDPTSKFTSSVDQLLHDTELCAKMAASARQTIKESYSFSDTASAYAILIQKHCTNTHIGL